MLGSKLVTASLPLHFIAALSYALYTKCVKKIKSLAYLHIVDYFLQDQIDKVNKVDKYLAASISVSNKPR